MWNIGETAVRVTRVQRILAGPAGGLIDPFDLVPGGFTGTGTESIGDFPAGCIIEFRGSATKRIRAGLCISTPSDSTCKIALTGP